MKFPPAPTWVYAIVWEFLREQFGPDFSVGKEGVTFSGGVYVGKYFLFLN